MKNNLSLIPFLVILAASSLWLLFMYEGKLDRLFITSDQLSFKQFEKKDYAKAAQNFENLSYKGASFYRNAEFKKARYTYQNLSKKEDTFNLGNAYVMLGDYDNAIKTYERALKIDPNFKKAQENLVVAKGRKILKEPENDGQQGVGMLGADEIVYDNSEGKGVDDDTRVQKDTQGGNPNWLDRLQTSPKDFLKNKFRYQYEMKEGTNAK